MENVIVLKTGKIRSLSFHLKVQITTSIKIHLSVTDLWHHGAFHDACSLDKIQRRFDQGYKIYFSRWYICLPPKFMQPLYKSHFIHPPSRNLQEIYHENFVILVDANLPTSRLRRFSFPFDLDTACSKADIQVDESRNLLAL